MIGKTFEFTDHAMGDRLTAHYAGEEIAFDMDPSDESPLSGIQEGFAVSMPVAVIESLIETLQDMVETLKKGAA